MRSKSVVSSILVLALIPIVFAFVNCSSSGDSSAPTDTDSGNNGNDSLSSLDSLYVGAYQEDQATNPEDPTAGTIYLNLPDSGAFSGQMFFTYVGCQSSNVGVISGTRTKNGATDLLNGNWNGSVDGTQQSGSFSGAWTTAQKAITGQYSVLGGKQPISIPNCIDYYIAPKGTFNLSPVGTVMPASLNLAADTNGATWTSMAGSAYTIVSVLDAQAALANSAQAVMDQTIIYGNDTQHSWSQLPLVTGRRYIAVLLVVDPSAQVLGRGSVAFVK